MSVPTCSGSNTDSFVGGTGGNTAAGVYSTVAGGQSNMVCDGWGVIAGGYEGKVSGSGANAVDSFIGGGEFNVVSSTGGDNGIVAGNSNNIGGEGDFIGAGESNSISGTWSVIGGGQGNTIGSGATYGFIGGGAFSSVSSNYATAPGGYKNTASGQWATVAGGNANTASGPGSNVAGGANNVASGAHASIGGGSQNTASGNQSYAAGVHSNAATAGSWVWSDDTSNATQLSSTGINQFLARATGGFAFWTNATNTVGATLAPGSGTWASASDRNMKTHVVALDDDAILAKVAQLPISRWSYVSERGVQHVGPMAQDFYAAFRVGEDDKHITSIDEDGVALAAIKALRAQAASQSAQIASLHARAASQTAEIAALKREVEQLRSAVLRTIR